MGPFELQFHAQTALPSGDDIDDFQAIAGLDLAAWKFRWRDRLAIVLDDYAAWQKPLLK